MALTISSEMIDRMIAQSLASPLAEICGLLLGTARTVETVEPCLNVAPDPRRAFEIDPAALFAAHRRARAGGQAVIGHYHSHPSGLPVPSPRDAAQAVGDGAIWLILGGGRARAWCNPAPAIFMEEDIVRSEGPAKAWRD